MKTSNKGFAIVFAIIVMAVGVVLLTGLLFNANTTLSIQNNDLKSTYAKSFAELGLNKYQTIMQQSYNFYKEGERWKEYENDLTNEQLELAKCGHFTAIGLDLDRMRDGLNNQRTVSTPEKDLPVNGSIEESHILPNDVQGGYLVRLSGDGLTLESQGYFGDSFDTARALATARVSFQVQTVGSAWQNAIFAGGEAPSNNMINGNVAVYGSVHLIGENNDPALTLGGGAGIFEDYAGDGGGGTNIINQMNAIAGPNQHQVKLCTELKIRKGQLHFGSSGTGSGSSTVGTTSSPIIAAYLGSGTSDASKVHTKDDKIYGYSGSLDVSFPKLDQNHPDEFVIPAKDPTVQIIELGGTCNEFQTGSGNNSTIQFPPPGATPSADPPYTGCLSDTSINNALELGGIAWLPDAYSCNLTNVQDAVNGLVSNFGVTSGDGYLCIAGDNVIINTGAWPLEIKYPGGNNKTVYYEGRAAIRTGSEICEDPTAAPPCTRRDIEIRENFIPRNPNATPYFPEDSIISLVANGDVSFAPKGGGGSTSNLEVAAAVYAQGTATFSKQTLVVGAVVADSIDASQNVPQIAYEPRVPDNLPQGSPGAGISLNQNVIADTYERR